MSAAPKKILHLIDFLGPGGAQEVLKSILFHASPEFNHEVVALTRQKDKYGARFEAAGIPVTYLGNDWSPQLELKTLTLACRVRGLVRRKKPALLHLHLPGAMVVGCIGTAGLPVKRFLNVYAWKAQLPWWVYPAIHLLTPMLHRIECVDAVEIPWVPKEKLVFAYPGVDPDADFTQGVAALKKEFSLEGRGPFLFSVGRLHPDKGHVYAIEAFTAVQNEFPDAVLFVLGDGPEDERKRLAAKAGKGVIFTGYRQDLNAFYGLGGFFVRASINEYGNVSNIFSQLAGLVGVGFDVSRVLPTKEDFIVAGRTGVLVPLKDTGAMARVIIKLAGNREEFGKLSRSAREYALERWDARQTMVAPIEKAYRELV